MYGNVTIYLANHSFFHVYIAMYFSAAAQELASKDLGAMEQNTMRRRDEAEVKSRAARGIQSLNSRRKLCERHPRDTYSSRG